MSKKDVKVYYKIFKLLENGQIDKNCFKSNFCYSSTPVNKIDIEILLNKFFFNKFQGKEKYKLIVTKIIKTNYPNHEE